MKNILLIIAVVAFSVIAGIRLSDSRPSRMVVQDLRAQGIDDVYLKVFQKFKKASGGLGFPETEPLARTVKRDPFMLLVSKPAVAGKASLKHRKPPFRLNGILWDGASPMAIVNGKIVKTGSKVANFRVTGITQRTVTLKSGGQTHVLRLPETGKAIRKGL